MKGRTTQHRQSSLLHNSDGDSYVGALVCATPQRKVDKPASVADAAGNLVFVGAGSLGAWLGNVTWDSFLDAPSTCVCYKRCGDNGRCVCKQDGRQCSARCMCHSTCGNQVRRVGCRVSVAGLLYSLRHDRGSRTDRCAMPVCDGDGVCSLLDS